MRVPHSWVPTWESARRLAEVASMRTPPDLVVAGGRVLNVFNGSLERADIGIAEGRIAWIAPPNDHQDAPRLPMDGRILVPGLIEPHAHPDLIYGPLALSAAAYRYGTTTLCADLLTLTAMLSDASLLRLLTACEAGPARLLWALRASAEGGGLMEARLSAERMGALIDRVSTIVTIGEMTAWREFVEGDARLFDTVADARRRGMRINGHLPGASAETLRRTAVAGISDDHESLDGRDARARLDAGFWVMVRQSSLRPDARRIAAGLRGHPSLHRAMLTTDGPVAADLETGHLDHVVREVIGAGLAPFEAIRMATINPATYLGLDQYIGALAPGRLADIVAVDDLRSFRPEPVVRGGRNPTGNAVPYPSDLTSDPIASAVLTTTDLHRAAADAPSVRLDGVITRPMPTTASRGALAALVARDGTWISTMWVTNVSIPALVSSFTGTGDILLLGEDFGLLLAAYRRVVGLQGAIVTPERTLPLPLLGVLSDRPMAEVATAVADLAEGLDVRGPTIPLEFLLLFLTLGVLPELRLTSRGVLDVKTGAIRLPSTPLPMVPRA